MYSDDPRQNIVDTTCSNLGLKLSIDDLRNINEILRTLETARDAVEDWLQKATP
jgi:hypothetical protein